MKYRLSALILVLLLLLTSAACAFGDGNEQETETALQTAEQELTQQTSDVFFRLGKLPDSLACVPAAGNPLRLYNGYITEFYPSASYGSVFIYEGSITVCRNEEGKTAEVVSYGLCTGGGQLITDAVFSDAYTVTIADGTVYYALEKLDRVDDGKNEESQITVFFVSTDGAWSSGVFTVVGDDVSVTALNNGGLCMLVETGGEYSKCYLLNKNCDVQSFISSSDTVEYSFGSFSGGLCPVSRTENGKTEAYYIDVMGNKLFGGYSAAESFKGSRAVARDEKGDYIVIDTTGFKIIGPEEYTISSVGGSYFVCKDAATGGTAVYDSSGVLRRVVQTKGNIRIIGKTVPVIFEESTGIYYSIFTGTQLRCHNTGEVATEYLGFGDYYVYYGKSEDGLTVAYIFNANGDFVYSVYAYGGIIGSAFANDIIAVSSETGDGSIRFISLASRSLIAEIQAESVSAADADGLFVHCVQTGNDGRVINRIYRLPDMSVIAEGFGEAHVILAGTQTWVNSRTDGRLRLLLPDGSVLLDLPESMSD